MTTTQDLQAVPVSRANPLQLLSAGRRAVGEVPGLRGFIAVGFLANYLVFAVVAGTILLLAYYFVLAPFSAWLASLTAGDGFWMTLFAAVLGGLLWLTQALVWTATVLLGFVLSVTLMSLWYEGLVARISAHLRPGGDPPPPFSIRALVQSMGRSLADGLWLIFLALMTLVLGLIPVVGPVLVLLIGSYLLGREVRDPYLALRIEQGDDPKTLARGLAGWTIQTGFLPVVLAMIPVVGWLLLPAAMIYLVAGFAWRSEEGRAA